MQGVSYSCQSRDEISNFDSVPFILHLVRRKREGVVFPLHIFRPTIFQLGNTSLTRGASSNGYNQPSTRRECLKSPHNIMHFNSQSMHYFLSLFDQKTINQSPSPLKPSSTFESSSYFPMIYILQLFTQNSIALPSQKSNIKYQ